MRAIEVARKLGQGLADRSGETYVIWTIGWRTVLQPEGKEVPGGMATEYIYPTKTEETPA